MTRITDVFNDARQPMWSPDGRTIVFFAYRDGGYDIWAINPDGIEPAQADLGPVRRSRADLFARRHPHRLLLGSRRRARQRLQHLDARSAQRRAQADHQGPERRLHAHLVARRQRDRLRDVAGQLRIDLGHERAIAGRSARPQRQGRAPRCAVVGAGRPAAVSRHRQSADALRDRRQAGHRHRERVRVPRVVGVEYRIPLRVRRQDPPALGRRPADADG